MISRRVVLEADYTARITLDEMDNINWVLAELMKVKPGGASAYRAYNVGGLLGDFLAFKIHVHLRIRETDAVGVEVALNAF